MNKFLIIPFLCCFSLNTFAQHRNSEDIVKKLMWDDQKLNILIDTRIDLQLDYLNDSLNNRSFKSNTLKIWLVGDITPKIHYRVRQRLNKPQTPLRDGYSTATDQAWIAFDLNDQWNLTLGKQAMQFGTFEYDYSGADIYLPTMIYNDLNSSKTGLNIAYHRAKQTLNLQIINSDSPQFASEKYKNKALGINLLWEGNLLKDIIKTRWAYGAFQHDKTKFYNWITLGTQINITKFTGELDYYLGDRDMDYSSLIINSDLGYRYVRDNSISINLKYNLSKIKPSIKIVYNNRHDKEFGFDAYQSKAGQAAIEYYPFSSKQLKDLRFHTAYTYSNTNFKGNFQDTPKTTSQTFYLGTRWLFKAK